MQAAPSVLSSDSKVSPLRELIQLAAPTVAQMASYTVMQFIDAVVLSHVGEPGSAIRVEAPTAVGNAGFIGFSLISFGMGVMFVVNAMASQEFGRKRFKRCGRWMWQGIYFAVAFSILSLAFIPLARPLFDAFGHSESLAAKEATYLQIFLLTPVFKLVGVAAGQFLLATGRPSTSLSAAVAGVSANAIVAVPFIHGRFGIPAGGVTGAAWAQNVGSVVEGLILIAYAFNATSRNRFGSLNWRFRPEAFKKLLKIGLGTAVQITAEVSAWSLFMVYVVAHLGETANAANQFMFRYMAISFMPAFGISQAVTALVGRSVGENRPDLALRRAALGYWVSTTYMLLCGVGFAVFRYPLMRFFTDDLAVQEIGATLLLFAAIYQLFDAANVIYNGALRGVGDTFVPACATAGLCWGINVFLGSVIVRVHPEWGVSGPWTACTIYGLILAVFAMCRFKYGPWRRKLAAGQSKHDQIDGNLPVPAAAAGLGTASEA